MAIVDRRANPSDEDVDPRVLVERSLAGCERSFAALTQRYRFRLTQLISKRLGGNSADAEDIVQEAFLKVHQHLSQYDPRFQFSTWLYTIAIRMANDRSRSQRRERRRLESFAQRQHLQQSPPAERLQSLEELGKLWQLARQALNASQYTAVWLRFGEELPLSEIARVMDKSQVGVRVLLHRARLTLLKQNFEGLESP